MPDADLFTLTEAAEVTGLTVEALRQRIKRGKIRAVKSNDGRLRLRLEPAEIDRLKADRPTGEPVSQPTSQPTGRPVDDQPLLRALESHLETLRELLAEQRRELEEARAARNQAEQRARELERAEGELGGLKQAVSVMEAALRQAQEEGREARQKAAEAGQQAEGYARTRQELETATAALERLRGRGFWARLFRRGE